MTAGTPKHLYLTFGGRYASGPDNPERWQCGLRLALVFGSVDAVGTLPSNYDADVDSQASTVSGFDGVTVWGASVLLNTFDAHSYMTDYGIPSLLAFIQTSLLISSDALWDTAKLVMVEPGTTHTGTEPEGKTVVSTRTVSGRTSTWNNGTGVAGGASAGMFPPDDAMVASLHTLVIGRRGRGRIYTPAINANMLTGFGRLDSSHPPRMVTAVGALLEGLSYTDTDSAGAHVRPIVTGQPWTDYGVVDHVSCDDIVDEQRRRKRQLVPVQSVGGTLSYG